jgi:hypothetical protein
MTNACQRKAFLEFTALGKAINGELKVMMISSSYDETLTHYWLYDLAMI